MTANGLCSGICDQQFASA